MRLWRLVLLAASCVPAPVYAQLRTPPQVWAVPRRDSVITPSGRKSLLFGFRKEVVDSTAIPVTAPARAYCVTAKRDGDLIVVDSVAYRAEDFELPVCRPELTAFVIRPACEITTAEHLLWVVQKIRPVILFCDMPPKVFLLSGLKAL